MLIRSRVLLAAVLSFSLSSLSLFAEEPEKPQTLFKNVQVWDGTSKTLSSATNVLIEGSTIKKVGASTGDARSDAAVIEGQGKVLMPGLIDMHSHLTLSSSSAVAFENSTWEEIGARTALVAEEVLLDGFTSVRDMGGMNGKGVKRMIDNGELDGPRIFPSGGFIGATSSHSDFRLLTMRNPTLDGVKDSNMLRLEVGYVVDGVDQVLAASRRNFQLGASQLKLMIGGGVATEYDPWHSTTFTFDEIKAAVDVADGYGSYVAAHINQPESIKLAIEAGVKSVEHGFVIDEPTMKMLVNNDVWLSSQLTGTSRELTQLPSLTPENLRKLDLAHAEMSDFYNLVKKYKPKQVFAVDAVLASRDVYINQRRHEIYLFAQNFGNHAMLKAATSSAGELLGMTKQTTYHDGPIGVIQDGAYADILLVDGNPLEDISVIGGSELWLKAPKPEPISTINLIMKGGEIYKNTL